MGILQSFIIIKHNLLSPSIIVFLSSPVTLETIRLFIHISQFSSIVLSVFFRDPVRTIQPPGDIFWRIWPDKSRNSPNAFSVERVWIKLLRHNGHPKTGIGIREKGEKEAQYGVDKHASGVLVREKRGGEKQMKQDVNDGRHVR